MEQLCKNLLSTYDTNILEHADKFLQDAFLKVSLENIKNKDGKQVLMQLISNHYDENVQKPIAEFIGGPKTLTIHYHSGFKKLIYLFGEWHANTMDCQTFKKGAVTVPAEDYIHDLMIKTDVFLDIYFEIISYKNGEYEYEPYADGRSNELFKKFRQCLQYNTRSDISCQLARVHYFDIRDNDVDNNIDKLEENKVNILWFYKKLDYIILNKKEVKEAVFYLKLVLQNYPKITTLLRQLLQDEESVCKFMIKQVEENPYIKKELSKIHNSKIKEFILDFYYELICKEISQVINYIRTDILNILNHETNSDDILLESMKFTSLFLKTPMTHFTDVYLLARIFKDFDMKKKTDKSYFDQPIRAHNIIIYCGDLHANNYRDFLLQMGFKVIDQAGDLSEDIINPIPKTPKNCLDMRKIKQPFFSYSETPDMDRIGRTT